MQTVEKNSQRNKYLRSNRGSLLIGLLLGATAVLLSIFLLSFEKKILRLPTEADRAADAVLSQHARLQVGASQCRARNPVFLDLYNGYIRRHGVEVRMASDRLIHLQNRQSGHVASVHDDLADLANRASLAARADYSAFCTDSFKVLQVIMSQVDPGELTEFTRLGDAIDGMRLAVQGR